MQCYVYSFPKGKTVNHGIHDLDKDHGYGINCLNDGTPVEDLGDYLISEALLSDDQAFEKFTQLADTGI